MKRIYAAHSTDFDYENEYYRPLRALKGFEFVFPHEKNRPPALSKDTIRQCDAFICEVTFPKWGPGVEIGWADSFGLPILFLIKKGAKMSSSLPMVSPHIIEYDTIEASLNEIERKLVEMTGKKYLV